jgi:hypothetical protein
MAVVTACVQWRGNTPTANRTNTHMLMTLRDFIVGTGVGQGGWTLLTDQTTATRPYIVVTFNRNTGFPGDNPIIYLGVYAGGQNYTSSPYVYMLPYESWDSTALVGTNPGVVNAGANSYFDPAWFTVDAISPYSLSEDSDLWISVDTTGLFILTSSQWNSGDGLGNYPVTGVTCVQRLAGDSDLGSFYGHFDQFTWGNSKTFYIPKRWDGQTGLNGVLSSQNKLGQPNNNGLYYPNESGQHVIFDMGCSFPTLGKLKGQLYGVGTTTYSYGLGHHTLLPNATSPQYLNTKWNGDMRWSLTMQVASTHTILS